MLGECFDPTADVEISQHVRPHWSQTGAVVFITFRLADSIPKKVLNRWDREKREWLRARGRLSVGDWKSAVRLLPDRERIAFHRRFDRIRESFLDTCHGECLLRAPDYRRVVVETLDYFDRQRYRLGDFVVMPNHVHLLAVFNRAESMRRQCRSWLHYSAYRINQLRGQKGKIWQQEPFDHLARSPRQYEYLRKYIEQNPVKAGLRPGEYEYRRANDAPHEG